MLALFLCFADILQKFLSQVIGPIVDHSFVALSCKRNYLRMNLLRPTLVHHLAGQDEHSEQNNGVINITHHKSSAFVRELVLN